MSKQYDPEILKKLQLCELEILKDFQNICSQNNLSYWAFGGTGIGALRHGGFIPWDDDIDLCMPRNEYEIAMQILERDYSDKYTVVNAQKYNDFPVMNTHIILNDSQFVTTEELKLKYPKGIFLDIFPVDNTPADEKERVKHSRKTWVLSKLLTLKHIPFPHLQFGGSKAKIMHCITACAYAFLKIFVPHKTLFNICLKECTKYNNQETGVFAYCCDIVPTGSVFFKDRLYPLRKEKFEDTEMCFPNNLEEILTNLYGDFMQIPPPEKQINHCPDILVFPKNFEN